MSKMFKKENIMPVVVLSVICLVVAALLGLVNSVTAPIIKEAEEQKAYESLLVVIDGKFEPVSPLPEGVADSVTAMYKATKDGEFVGYAVNVSVKGYAGEILMTVGVDADGKVTKVVITKQSESHGKTGMADYPDNFAGVAATDVPNVELFSGATISSTAIRKGVTDAVNAATGVEAEPPVDLAKSDEEIRAIIAEMADGVELEEISVEEKQYVRRVYKDKNGSGYFAQIIVISEHYGTVETETIVHVSNAGVIKNVKKLIWSVSAAMPEYGYNPPDEERVDKLYSDFTGKTLDGIDDVDLATGATNTSTNLAASIKSALETVKELIILDMPTPESDVIARAEALVGEGAELESVDVGESEYVRRIYRDKNGGGYVAYAVVISGYGYPESETLIHIGADGSLRKIEKITWKTSDAMYGYVPPTEDVVNAFYERLNNSTVTDIDGVELVTNATNTSTNVLKSVKEAITSIKTMIYLDMPTSESAVLEYAKELVGDSAELENITPEGLEYVRRLYRDKNGNGYVAYVVVISRYGTPETETVVHINGSGAIVGLKKVTWKPSDAAPDWGYNPPSEERVDALYADLIDKNVETIDTVDLKTGATTTGTTLVGALKEALFAVGELIAENEEENYTARIVGISAVAVVIVASVCAVIVLKKKKGGKNG